MSKVICPVCDAPVHVDDIEAHAEACLDYTHAKQVPSAPPPPVATMTADDASLLLAPEATKTWSSGLFDCHKHGLSCLLSLCAPQIQFSLTQARAFPEERISCLGWFAILVAVKLLIFLPFFTHPQAMTRYYEREDPMHSFEVIRARATYYSCLALVAIFTYRRVKLRTKFGIRGSALLDFCTMLWCTCCGLAQEYRHVEHEEEMAAAVAIATAAPVVEARISENVGPVEAIPVAKEV